MSRLRRLPPVVLLAAGALVIAIAPVIAALSTTAITLDETVYKYAAAQFADGFPGAVIDDRVSRGIARLYSLLITPIFAVLPGDAAVRVARTLNVVLFVSAALPVFLVTRMLVARTALAVAAGLLAVAVPWLTISTILFSEALAYLLFAWTVYAMLAALERPTVLREGIVIALLVALVTTRVQFVALLPAWFLLVVLQERRALARRFPVHAAGAALAVLLVLVGAAAGGLVDRLAGPYAGLRDREDLRGEFGLAALFEVEMLAIGVGVVPALVAAAWSVDAFAGRAGALARRFAVLAATLVATLFAATLFAQGGWLIDASEERYFIYAVPLIWVAAAAGLDRAVLPARRIAVATVTLAIIVALVPLPVVLNGEQIYLAPVSGTLNRVGTEAAIGLGDLLGTGLLLSARDILALGVLAIGLLTWLLWRRPWRRDAVLLATAAGIQLAFVAFLLTAIHGGVSNIPDRTDGPPFAELGWLDRATPGEARVVLLDNIGDPGREDAGRAAIFWNDELVDTYRPTDLQRSLGFPVDLLGTRAGAPGADLRVDPPPANRLALSATDAVAWQLAGRPAHRSPDGRMTVLELEQPARLIWSAVRLDADGQIAGPVAIRAAQGHRVTVAVEKPPVGARVRARVRLGGVEREFDTDRADRADLVFDLCGRRSPVAGEITPVATAEIAGQPGRFSAGRITAVRVERCGG